MNNQLFNLKLNSFVADYCQNHPEDKDAFAHAHLAFIRSEILGVAK